jgi:predicted small lipoprotein YifL
MKLKSLIGLMTLMFGVSSCSNLGPVALPPDRLGYNQSLLNSDDEQALLNIVRLRYSNTVYFMSVNSIVSQLSFSRDFTATIANGAPPPALLGTGSAGYTVGESPTITYTPLQGEDYIDRLLTPVNLEVVYMLLRSGWSVPRVTRIIIQQFGEANNATFASKSVSDKIPIYKPFLNTVNALKKQQFFENVIIASDKAADGTFAIKFTIKNFKKITPADRLILNKLNVHEQSSSFWLVSTPPKDKNHILVETRTMLGLFNYLSKGVDVPEYDANKLAPMTYYPDGKLFDWHGVTDGVIHIKTSRFKPLNASVAVPYKGSWFYITEDDFSSKETMNIVSILMGIYQQKIKSSLPVFTVS